MKIIYAKTENQKILFDDGSYMLADHTPDWYEHNYADFDQLEESAFNTDFDKETFKIEEVPFGGLRFGDEYNMFFVPCYSEQNGFYSDDINVWYYEADGSKVLRCGVECNVVLD